MSTLRSAADWGDVADADAPRAGSTGTAAAVSDETAPPKKARPRRLKVRPVGEPILQREHHQTQLRHRAPLGLQVNWFRIQERASGWNHQQCPTPNVRTLLIPQRQLSGKLRILINSRLDL